MMYDMSIYVANKYASFCHSGDSNNTLAAIKDSKSYSPEAVNNTRYTINRIYQDDVITLVTLQVNKG